MSPSDKGRQRQQIKQLRSHGHGRPDLISFGLVNFWIADCDVTILDIFGVFLGWNASKSCSASLFPESGERPYVDGVCQWKIANNDAIIVCKDNQCCSLSKCITGLTASLTYYQ